MANKHYKPEEIVTKLRQVDVRVGHGMARVDAIRQIRYEQIALHLFEPRDLENFTSS